MLLLNDEELLEGISGATAFILLKIFFYKYIPLNTYTESFIAWILVWYFRKIVNNIYVQKYKKKGKHLISINL